jgi:hypothetical protein
MSWATLLVTRPAAFATTTLSVPAWLVPAGEKFRAGEVWPVSGVSFSRHS